MIPAGSAIIAIPKNADIIPNNLPPTDVGYMSPYPTVVNEMVAQ